MSTRSVKKCEKSASEEAAVAKNAAALINYYVDKLSLALC